MPEAAGVAGCEAAPYLGDDCPRGSSRRILNGLDEPARCLRLLVGEYLDGTVFAVQYRIEVAPEWPQDLLHVQGPWPVELIQFEVEVHGGWRVRPTVDEGRDPGSAGEIASGTWRFVDVPARPALAGSRAPVPLQLELIMEPIPENGEPRLVTWRGVAGWTTRRVHPGVHARRDRAGAHSGCRTRQDAEVPCEMGGRVV